MFKTGHQCTAIDQWAYFHQKCQGLNSDKPTLHLYLKFSSEFQNQSLFLFNASPNVCACKNVDLPLIFKPNFSYFIAPYAFAYQHLHAEQT